MLFPLMVFKFPLKTLHHQGNLSSVREKSCDPLKSCRLLFCDLEFEKGKMRDQQDPAYGVKTFSIAGRMIRERERLKGMTDTERQWRAQWLKDQQLSHDEPREIPEFYKETTNIFRRLYKSPLRAFENMLVPIVGENHAFTIRHTITKSFLLLCAGWVGYYLYKYHSNDWTRAKTLEVFVTRPVMYPDHPDYPNYQKFDNYYDQGFYSSPYGQPKKKN